MAREEINIIELLGKIKNEKQKFQQLYDTYISPVSHGRLMVSIYNPSTNRTINGSEKINVYNEIKDINSNIRNTYNNLQKLILIKEEVNVQSKLLVPNPYNSNEPDIYMSITQILALKSEFMKKYTIEYMDKLLSDYHKGIEALESRQSAVMGYDRVNAYVLAKLNSLNIKVDENSNIYNEFKKEYIEANKMELLNPLNINDDIKNSSNKFYEKIENILLTYNAKTRIWIDLDDDEHLWGFMKSDDDIGMITMCNRSTTNFSIHSIL